MKYLAIIPARGGSKSITKKNIHPLSGKPLIAYTIQAALGSKLIDRIIVSTDCLEIASVVSKYHVEAQMRPPELGLDTTPTLPVLNYVVDSLQKDGYLPDAICTLQPTSPLRSSRHIDEAIAIFNSRPDADSLVSCVRVPHNFVPTSLMKITKTDHLVPYLDNSVQCSLRRQDKPTFYARNGAAVYITRRDRIKDFIFGGCCVPYVMNQIDSLDIDEYEDITHAEYILNSSMYTVS